MPRVSSIGHGPLVLLLLAASGLALFLWVAEEVDEGEHIVIDRAILTAFREPGNPAELIGPPWTETMGRDFSALGGFTVLGLLTVAIAAYLWMTDRKTSALYIGAAVVTGVVFAILLKAGFDRSRPEVVPHATLTDLSSFPSGHSMLSAVTYLTLGLLVIRDEERKPVRILIMGCSVLLTLAVGISRIYLGVHWPTDVLAGWAVGLAWAALCRLLADRFLPR